MMQLDPGHILTIQQHLARSQLKLAVHGIVMHQKVIGGYTLTPPPSLYKNKKLPSTFSIWWDSSYDGKLGFFVRPKN